MWGLWKICSTVLWNTNWLITTQFKQMFSKQTERLFFIRMFALILQILISEVFTCLLTNKTVLIYYDWHVVKLYEKSVPLTCVFVAFARCCQRNRKRCRSHPLWPNLLAMASALLPSLSSASMSAPVHYIHCYWHAMRHTKFVPVLVLVRWSLFDNLVYHLFSPLFFSWEAGNNLV